MTVEEVKPAEGLDAAEILRKAAEYGAAAVRRKPLEIGSGVELAERVADDLRVSLGGNIVQCEGEFLFYNGKYWEAFDANALRLHIHQYDGLTYGGSRHKVIRLASGQIDGILKELGSKLAVPDWFAERRVGINCQNGFISFEGDGPVLLKHAPEHRQRHLLPAEWHGPVTGFEGSLLERLLHGCFKDDEDADAKIALLWEVAGAAALGYGPRLVAPKAVVLLGRSAENGKSQVIWLLRGVLPSSAVVSIPPSKFCDEKYVFKLVGKLLNTSDELGTAGAISSETFKHLITGEPVPARDLYRSPIELRGAAQHVFSCNQLPSFHGGMDRGVMRRLLVLVFNRTIPFEERVPHIAEQIVRNELALVLSLVVEGAARVLHQRVFTEPPSCRLALMEWAQGADAVQGWLAERVIHGEGLTMASRAAYSDFEAWARGIGYARTLPSINTFSQRLQAAGLKLGHSGNFRGFIGVALKDGGWTWVG